MTDTSRPRRFDDTLLGVMSCDIARRPAGARHFGHIAEAILDVRREGGQLVVHYADSARAALAEVVAAEQVCCATIGWTLDEFGTTLRVTARSEQLDLLEQFVRLPNEA